MVLLSNQNLEFDILRQTPTSSTSVEKMNSRLIVICFFFEWGCPCMHILVIHVQIIGNMKSNLV